MVNDGSTDNSLSICKKYKKMMICSIILAISFLKVADEFDLDKAKRKVAKYLNRIDFTKEVVWKHYSIINMERIIIFILLL